MSGRGSELIGLGNRRLPVKTRLPVQKCGILCSKYVGGVPMFETERLTLRVLRADKVALRRLAKAEGETMSVVVRRILRDELERRNMLPADRHNDIRTRERAHD